VVGDDDRNKIGGKQNIFLLFSCFFFKFQDRNQILFIYYFLKNKFLYQFYFLNFKYIFDDRFHKIIPLIL